MGLVEEPLRKEAEVVLARERCLCEGPIWGTQGPVCLYLCVNWAGQSGYRAGYNSLHIEVILNEEDEALSWTHSSSSPDIRCRPPLFRMKAGVPLHLTQPHLTSSHLHSTMLTTSLTRKYSHIGFIL